MRSILDPEIPGGAYDAFLPEALPQARTHRAWTPADGPLPALYLSHGAPPLFDDDLWIRQLFDWAQSLPKPKAILIVSAHWEDAPLALSASAAEAVHATAGSGTSASAGAAAPAPSAASSTSSTGACFAAISE